MIFAAMGGWLLLDETVPLRWLLGCALILVGMLVSQQSDAQRAIKSSATATE